MHASMDAHTYTVIIIIINVMQTSSPTDVASRRLRSLSCDSVEELCLPGTISMAFRAIHVAGARRYALNRLQYLFYSLRTIPYGPKCP
jgi:hypothetical protein